MNKLWVFFQLLIILLASPKLFAFYEITKECEMALMEILNLRMDKAHDRLQQERLKSPDNCYIDYLENYKEMVEIFVLEDKSSYNAYLEKFDYRLDKMEEKDPSTPYYRAIRAEMLAQTGLLNVVNGDEISGFIKIVKANNLLKKNFKDYPDFYLNKKLFGVFNVGFGNIPASVRWATNLFGLAGDTEDGFTYLNTYKKEVEGRPGLFSESLIYLIFAYQICADYQGAYEMLKRNYTPSISTTLGTYLYANTLDRVGRTNESLELLALVNTKNKEMGITFYPVLLLISNGKLKRLDKDADLNWLIYLENSKNENFKKEACNKLSLYYLIHGNKEKYESYKNMVTSYDKAVMRPDREADVDVDRLEPVSVELVKAQYLVAGSYFSRADIILEDFDPEQQQEIADKIQYYLIKGKILSAGGGYDQAMIYFNKAIDQGKKIPEHYAAEAALMAGNLAKKFDCYAEASDYFKLAQNIDCANNVYRDNIQKKAKTQLRYIKGQDFNP